MTEPDAAYSQAVQSDQPFIVMGRQKEDMGLGSKVQPVPDPDSVVVKCDLDCGHDTWVGPRLQAHLRLHPDRTIVVCAHCAMKYMIAQKLAEGKFPPLLIPPKP